MSNTVAGEIFEKVIEEVVQASQTDFEENGVSQQTLSELKLTWQQKLSARNVAQMPWDPKPAPPAQSSQSATNNAGNSSQSYSAPSHQTQVQNGSRIKTEPGTDQSYGNGSYMPQAMNPEIAQQRAASLLQQQYGSQATASLGAMQQQRGIALPGQQKPSGLQLPGQNPQLIQQQYEQQMKQQRLEAQQQQQPRIKTETDGAADDFPAPKRPRLGLSSGDDDALGDWNKYMASVRSMSADQCIQNDLSMREHIATMTRELESGLMKPLDQQQSRKVRKGKARARLEGIPQVDGDFSDDEKANVKDEEDENAINSDLDSSGDEAHNPDDDDDDIDSMLCTYDKVQRVKNKWKCVLKDGVFSANGKEYLFHKAQGEFEW